MAKTRLPHEEIFVFEIPKEIQNLNSRKESPLGDFPISRTRSARESGIPKIFEILKISKIFEIREFQEGTLLWEFSQFRKIRKEHPSGTWDPFHKIWRVSAVQILEIL